MYTTHVVIERLVPHPDNALIYATFDPEKETEFIESIKANGLLEPLKVTPDWTVLSGHRRLAAVKILGWHEVLCSVLEAPDMEEKDPRELLVEFNRYRNKTISERMKEAELLRAVQAEKGRKSMGDHSTSGHDTRKIVAEAVGMKARSFDKATKIFELAKTNENAKLVLEKLDRGEVSVDGAFKAVRKLVVEEEDKEAPEIPDFIRLYNSLTFTEIDPRFGIPHPGQIPGQIAGNVIYYFTEPGDLVVDPMAGGGSTIDVGEFLDRRVLGFDIAPRRPDIRHHDISTGFPELEETPQLIFMDPPYWNMMEEHYVKESSSAKSLPQFLEWYKNLIHDAAKTVRYGGFVALIIMCQHWRLPEDFREGYIDWPFLAYDAMQEAGLTPWARIHSQIPASTFSAFDVTRAQKERFMLPVARDIVIQRRLFR